MYIDKLYNIVNKYNNAYHNTIKTKPINVKSSTYINLEDNKEDLKFNGDNHV